MKILWFINIPLPEASLLIGKKPCPFGGWLVNTSKCLAEQSGIELTIAFPQDGVNTLVELKGCKITYFAFRPIKSKKKLVNNQALRDCISQVKPELVHVFGTEFAHTKEVVNICNSEHIKVVISIQGLVSIIEKHMLANLPWKAVYGATIRNILLRDNVINLKKSFFKRGKSEIEAIQKVNHIIGRTTWDKACTSLINPRAQYYHCNETLREEFYKQEWDIEKCEKYSLFVSQGQYPVKGLHYVIESMPLILKRFPETKLYISGKDITKSDTLKDKFIMTYYGKHIKKIIKEYGLEKHIIFTGSLNEKEMCQRYLKTNLFISPSTIENESNSLSEAKILGVPCISSYVGGVIDRIDNNEDGFFYQSDASYMLAYYVCKVFENKDLALKFSKNARENALNINNRDKNLKTLMSIYNEIIKY